MKNENQSKEPASASSVDRSDLLAKLRQGWSLELRGVGWHICEPRKAYTRTLIIPVDESLVNALIDEGVLKTKEYIWHCEAFISANTKISGFEPTDNDKH